MSWSTFRSNLLQKMSNYPYEDNNGFAKTLADEYDRCMKSGYDIVNKNPLKKGNKAAFQSAIESQQASGVASTSEAFYSQLFPLMGNAVIAYWAGAKLFETNPPILVTPPAIKNLYILPEGNVVVNPGVFGNTSVFPTTDIESFLNAFIFLAKTHLTTISGICNTLAQYPPPTPPAPSVVNWTGYQCSDGSATDEYIMSAEEIAGAKEDLKSAQILASTTKSDPVKQTAVDAIRFLRQKLAAKRAAATDPNQVTETPPPPPPPADADIGNKIVYYARLELGKTEQPLPPGKPENWGPAVQSYLKVVGIDEPAYWCAAFVSAIYKSAGASSANSAGCDEWRAWAKKKGLWSLQPAIGAAVLYGSEADAHHIGIVEKINGNMMTTIEGNTTGGAGFNRNGCGVFRKSWPIKRALGFVIPQDKTKSKKK